MKRLPLFLLLPLFLAGTAMGADTDHDGVPNERDRCPETARIKKVDPSFPYAVAVTSARRLQGAQAYPVDETGCEYDDDGDGVKNSADYCPDDPKEALAAGVAPNGCPKQSDGDGTPDYRDSCPGTPRGVRTDGRGCPITAQEAPGHSPRAPQKFTR